MNITKKLAKTISNYNDPSSLGTRLRVKRIAPLLSMIEVIFKYKGSVNMIDIGGTSAYWNILPTNFLEANNVKITIANLPGNRKPSDTVRFYFVEADGCDLSKFKDSEFDIAHSNSVIEHVGDWGRMSKFAAELSRVSRQYFVQTPNFWFPIEPHCMTPFFHWLPRPVKIRLIMRYQLGNWVQAKTIGEAVKIEESAQLLNRIMFQELFKDAKVTTEKYFGLSKSLIAIKT